jgi:hypothetical protein
MFSSKLQYVKEKICFRFTGNSEAELQQGTFFL